MKYLKITNGFAEMTDAYLLVRARFILVSMTGNPAFPTPSPTLQDLNLTINSFSAAVETAEGGDRQQIAVRNAIKQTLVTQLHLLGNYVLFTATGNDVAATSSGFRIGKVPTPRPALTTPQGLALLNGVNKGELKLKFKKVQGATAYMYEITPSPVTAASTWNTSINTVCKKQFSGLESGREYNCRVAAIGIKEQVVYSGVVSRVVL